MADRNATRPNIIVILTDDQGCWAMGCAGNQELKTPNLDRLAATGTRFENLFCASPVCSPARASLLTGRIPSQHGIHDWLRGGNVDSTDDRQIEYLAGMTAYTDILAANGYVCGMSGKWHLGASQTPQKSFSFWEVLAAGGSGYYNAPMIHNGEIHHAPQYCSDLFTDNALAFLEAQEGSGSPFYLSLHFTAPHSPWKRENHPADIYDEYFNTCAFDSTPREPMHPWQANTAPYGHDEQTRRDILSGYFAAVTAMDLNVGRVLDWLEAKGLREDTLIFFTSDNGMNMGHHGIYGKGDGTFPLNMYDTSVKVPGLISRPGHVPEGVVCDAMLSHYDFMPTLLDYVGLHCPQDNLPGRSFANILRGRPFTERENVVVLDEYGPTRMIRTREWKYVHRYPYGPHELYDLVTDAEERANLYAQEAKTRGVQELKARLDEWFACYVDPRVDGAREPVTGKGQVNLAGPAGKGAEAFADDWSYLADGGRKPRNSYPVFEE